jgi:peptidoglycan/LPS O-acetylase OafA/YrhL
VGCGLGLFASATLGIALSLALPILGTYLLFFAAFSPKLPVRNFGCYGDFSYGVYLYSFPIQQLLIQRFPQIPSATIFFLMALPLSVGAAALSWHCVEKHFLKLKRRSPNDVPAPARVDGDLLMGSLDRVGLLSSPARTLTARSRETLVPQPLPALAMSMQGRTGDASRHSTEIRVPSVTGIN